MQCSDFSKAKSSQGAASQEAPSGHSLGLLPNTGSKLRGRSQGKMTLSKEKLLICIWSECWPRNPQSHRIIMWACEETPKKLSVFQLCLLGILIPEDLCSLCVWGEGGRGGGRVVFPEHMGL